MNVNLVSIEDASKQLGVAKYFVRKLVLDNKVHYLNAGSKYLVDLDDLKSYLKIDTSLNSTKEVEYLTIRQLAKKGVLTEYMIRKKIANGELPCIKVSDRKFLIEYNTFLDWIANTKGEPNRKRKVVKSVKHIDTHFSYCPYCGMKLERLV